MGQDGRDINYTTDEDGKRWLVDDNGNPVYSGGSRVPGPAREKSSSGFTYYDDSQGHCSFCGSLTCRGGCFK